MPKDYENMYKVCRMNAGKTQETAAVLLHVSERTLSDYENGKTLPPQDVVASMVKVYGAPTLAWWHVRNANPDLAPFLADAPRLRTDSDVMFQLDLADVDVTKVKDLLREVFRDGRVSPDEKGTVDVSSEALRTLGSKLIEAAGYLEERRDKE